MKEFESTVGERAASDTDWLFPVKIQSPQLAWVIYTTIVLYMCVFVSTILSRRFSDYYAGAQELTTSTSTSR